MGYIIVAPFKNGLEEQNTIQDVVNQIWDNFEIIGIQQPNLQMTPILEQAKHYYNDATKSHWRTAGLLYYYSFLNLAKLHLLIKGKVTYSDLKGLKFHHGLSFDTPSTNDLMEFKIKIASLQSGSSKKLFSFFYESLTRSNWPFPNEIEIKLKDIIPYCIDVGVELKKLFSIETTVGAVRSLIRTKNKQSWLELATLEDISSIIETFPEWSKFYPNGTNQLNDEDVMDWLLAFRMSRPSLNKMHIMRTPIKDFSDTSMNDQILFLCNSMEKFSLQIPYQDPMDPAWFFIPEIQLNGVKMKWHPLLSDYLFAFAMSVILRYFPIFFETEQKNSFLSQAWCRQSANISLKYFLMETINPGIRVHRI